MANLIVAGAAGRMGRLLVALGSRDPQHRIVGALEAHGNSALGSDAGELAGVGKLGVKIPAPYAMRAKPDTVTLDFTTAPASMEHLEVASKAGAAIVIGSTGFSPERGKRGRGVGQKTRRASMEHLEVASKAGAAIVIGSTGFTPEMETRAREFAQKTRTVIAPNMSFGVNVLAKFVAEVPPRLPAFG